MSAKASRTSFVFLSVFSIEGGIQSYVKDILRAYASQKNAPSADVFLLRDKATDPNPFEDNKQFRFHYFGDNQPSLGRLKLALTLGSNLFQKQYSRVVCGHILLSPLVSMLCRMFQIPYTIMTYGKEVWISVSPLQKRALQQATDIWTISRYSRDLACSSNGLEQSKFYMLPCIVNGDAFTPGEKESGLVTKYGLQDNRVLMTVARLWPGDIYKGVDVTIRALPEILQVFPDVKYLVLGKASFFTACIVLVYN
ncbi:MAG: glycosyltransferase family 4 protein, partial [Leptolyngbya sp. SIO1D8]|nr:glycosyltransferase family 4 protein [Leptolyngbya sp. SIO1D8]